LPAATEISLEIFNAAGALVRRLVEGQLPAGSFSTQWDGRDDNGRELPTGIYFARIVTAHGTRTGRVILAR
jgi:flagellar hook assembly protein FlgD